MIVWTKKFPWQERPLGYLRLLRARHRYFDRIGWRRGGIGQVLGDQQRLAALRDKHKGQRCFIIANGPSLKDFDLSPLKNEITLGCNGIYKMFPEWGWHVDYFMMEDIEQVELRRRDIAGVNGPLKLFALYNAYAFPADADTVFFNAPRVRGNLYYWTECYPQFSRDFASVAHLGSTVTYLMLQLAYHLGCDPVYIIGLDHNYGELPANYKPEKITLTEENLAMVRGLHFSNDYYKVGDAMGVPDVARQEAAYAKARDVFAQDGRHVYNASARTKLDVFERVDFNSLFPGAPP
jgi:hypothetical protein